MSLPFTAICASKCADCGEWIVAGDVIRFGPDGVVHDDCDGCPDFLTATGPVCDRCWLTQPCDCDVTR